MTTVNCWCCKPELKLICKIIGWIGVVANIIFCAVFSYRLIQNIGPFASSLGLLICVVFHFIGSIFLLISISVGNKWFFLPWVISNLAAIIFLIVGAFIWDSYYNWVMAPILVWAQTYICKYIADRVLKDKVKQKLNI